MRRLMKIGRTLALAAIAASGSGEPPAPMGPSLGVASLRFDPRDADFSAWLERFRVEIYERWPSQAAALQLGDSGRVELEFTVTRSGSVGRTRVRQASGPKRLRQAAEGTVRAARLLPLPPAYEPRTLTARATFVVGEEP